MSQNQNENSGVQTIPVNAETHSELTENATNSQNNTNIESEEIIDGELEPQQDDNNNTQNDETTQESADTTSNSENNSNNSSESAENNKSDAPNNNKDKSDGTDWKDAYIRLRADFENYRKRTSKEQDDIRRRERERVVNMWLDIYDNAERALDSMTEKSGPWHEGFSSLIQQMDKVLAQLNIKVVNDVGGKFDAKRHDIISVVQDPTKENNTIVYVMQKGFVYENGDVARIAKVVVVKNPS